MDTPNSLISLEFPSAVYSLLPQKFCLQQDQTSSLTQNVHLTQNVRGAQLLVMTFILVIVPCVDEKDCHSLLITVLSELLFCTMRVKGDKAVKD